MNSNLDLNLLTALEALLAERNVTRAARRLNLSQSALSAQLARLRVLLGDPLLLPAQRGMIPTQRALDLQEPLHRALEQVRAVVTVGTAFDPASSALTVSIAATDYIQYAVLMPLVAALTREAPGMRLAFRVLDAAALPSQMERGEVDMALMTPDTVPDHLRLRPLFEERYVAVVRHGHPGVGAVLDLDGFCALGHILVSPDGGGFSGATDSALAAHGRARRVAVSAASFLIVPEMVERSDLIAMVPERLVRDRGDRLRVLEPPLPVPGFAIALAWHDRTNAHPAQRWLRSRLQQVCGGV